MELSNDQLCSYAHRGIIAGPIESKETFKKRLETLKLERNKFFYAGFEIDWVEVTYSKKKLPFWQGGCTWIDENRAPSIQLHPNFNKKSRHFGYSKEEVLDHELVHVMRSGFDEPIYEEIFAYQTSAKWWRRYLGPLFRSNKEFLILFAFLVFVPLGSIPFFAFQGGRLYFSLKRLAKAKKTLSDVMNHPEKVSLFLTDREIRDFSRITSDEVSDYITNNPTLRWTQLRLLDQSSPK